MFNLKCLPCPHRWLCLTYRFGTIYIAFVTDYSLLGPNKNIVSQLLWYIIWIMPSWRTSFWCAWFLYSWEVFKLLFAAKLETNRIRQESKMSNIRSCHVVWSSFLTSVCESLVIWWVHKPLHTRSKLRSGHLLPKKEGYQTRDLKKAAAGGGESKICYSLFNCNFLCQVVR